MVPRAEKEQDARSQVQSDGVRKIKENNYTGILLVSPRVGKSKILIDSIIDKEDWKVVISSPYDTIRENWGNEWIKWNNHKSLKEDIGFICHRSLNKIDNDLDLLVIDEVQTLSQNNIDIIKLKKPKRILGLTGTLNQESKINLKIQLALKPIFEYSIEQAIADGIISNFEIIIVKCELNNQDKYLISGTKKQSFRATEQEHYNFLTKQFEKFRILSWKDSGMEPLKMKYAGDRSRFIYEAKSKYEIAKKIVDNSGRCLIFTGLQKIADGLATSYHSKSKENNLEKFISGEIDKLAVIEMVNMGITIPNLKIAVIHQLKSNSEMSLQKILRMCNIEDEKIAKIYILVYKNTVDESWVNKALETVNKERISIVNYKDLKL